jgi:phage tail sheath protein FI
MPGINISTSVRTGPSSTTVRESSQAFFVGKALRGPTDTAVKISSIEEFELNYGGYVNGYYLHPTVQTFFEEGGSQCYVARAAHSGSPAAATLLLKNSTNTVVTLTAVGTGAWANENGVDELSAIVSTGTATGTKVVKIYKNGNLIMSTGNCTTNQQIAGKINAHPEASLLCTATVNPTYATSDLAALPSTLAYFGATGYTAGADGTAPSDTELVDALELFTDAYGTGAVSCPESADINDDLIAHANSLHRIAILHADSGLDPNVAGDYADLVAITQGIQSGDNGEHAAFYHPWIYVPTSTDGVTRLIPPDGYAAGARARAHNSVGQHQPGAGVLSAAKFVTGVEYAIGSAVSDNLDSECVNAIRVINNTIRIYGARACSLDTTNFRYITGQDVLNYVVVESYRELEDILFRPIDSRNEMFVAIKHRLRSILEGLRQLGALYEAFDTNGNRVDYGYSVQCDASINPVAQLVDGTVTARVGLRVTGIGDTIQVDIVKSSLTASVV